MVDISNSQHSQTVPNVDAAPGQNLPRVIGRRVPRSIVSTFLAAADFSAYVLACLAVAPLLDHPDGAIETQVFVLAAVVAIALNMSGSLYPGYRLHDFEILRRRLNSACIAAIFAVLTVLLVHGRLPSLLLIAAFLVAGLVVQPMLRCAVRAICYRLGLWGERAVIVAEPDLKARLDAHFRRHWQYGIRPEPYLRNSAAASPFDEWRVGLVAGDPAVSGEQLALLRQEFAEVFLLADMPDLKLGGLRPADIGGQLGVRIALAERRSGSETARRLLDLVVAVPAAVLALPIVALAGAAIYAIDPGPIFFRQTREGLGGKPVRVLKLRTMYQDAEQRLEALFASDPAMKAEWLAHFKLKRDPRILPIVGQFLRSTSCDELPQLFNVVVGDMGVVGPRPFPDYHLRAMDPDFRVKRHSVVPGLTGLWQVSERSNADLEQQQRLDEFYIDNRSLWLDLQILIRTIPAVFRRGGAY